MTISAFVLDALIAMLAHELGHVLAAHWWYIPVRKVGVSWKGMYIRRARTTGWPEVVVCLAGAAMNLLLAAAFQNLHWFAICNLIFALVNILPIPNSDGSHALEVLRAMRWEKLVDRAARRPA